MRFTESAINRWTASERGYIQLVTESMMIPAETIHFKKVVLGAALDDEIKFTFRQADEGFVAVQLGQHRFDCDDAMVGSISLTTSNISGAMEFRVMGDDAYSRYRSRDNYRTHGTSSRIYDILSHMVATELIRQRRPWFYHVRSLLAAMSSNNPSNRNLAAVSMKLSLSSGFSEGCDLLEPVADQLIDMMIADVPADWYVKTALEETVNLIGATDG